MKRHRTRAAISAPTGGVPVQFPLVRMTVHEDGAMTVLVDGEIYAPPDHAPAWERGSFSAILEAITTRLGSAVKVIVIEHDGSTFTDIVLPRRTAPPEADAAPAGRLSPGNSLTPAPSPSPSVRVTGTGFLAGEDVAVAPLVAHASAAPDGQVHTLLAQDRLPADTAELLLIGRISGMVQIVRAVP